MKTAPSLTPTLSLPLSGGGDASGDVVKTPLHYGSVLVVFG